MKARFMGNQNRAGSGETLPRLSLLGTPKKANGQLLNAGRYHQRAPGKSALDTGAPRRVG
jgi:hypothetical protein